MRDNSFTFEYHPAAIRHGPGVVMDIESELERRGLSRALIVTGSSLASASVVIDPVRNGTGDRLVGVFDGVTPEKYLETAYEGAKRVRVDDIDALVALGGGSSLDIAKQISVLAGHDRPLDDVVADILDQEGMILPDDREELTDVFAVPTTLPGADLSQVAGITLSMDPETTPKEEAASAGVSDERLMPTVVFHDLELFATTPEDILARSAMNGYDKGVEMLYTRYRNPITDATAMRGVQLLQTSLPAIRDESTSEDDLSRILQGIALAQYGLSTPNHYRASIIHAFGHALSRRYSIQQGVAHAIGAPHVLRYLFSQTDGRAELLARALGVADSENTIDGIVESVAGTRDALELPSHLRSIEEAKREHFPELARAVIEDPFMGATPEDLDATRDDIEAVFDAMW